MVPAPGGAEFWKHLSTAFASRLGAALGDWVVTRLRDACRQVADAGEAVPPAVSDLALDRYLGPDGPFRRFGARQVEAWVGGRLMAMRPEQREAVVAAAAAAGGADGPETLRQLVRILRRQA